MKINNIHKKSVTHLGKIEVDNTKSHVPELVTNSDAEKKYQMNAMAMYYVP